MAAADVGIAPLNPDYQIGTSGLSASDLAQLGYSSSDILSLENSYTPVVPNASAALASASGGAFVPPPTPNSADSMGISSVPTNPNNTPNPTGGWEGVATAIINSAAKGFTAYSTGSPSAAIPGARSPLGKANTGLLTTATGGTNWAMVGVIVLLAGAGMWAVVHFA